MFWKAYHDPPWRVHGAATSRRNIGASATPCGQALRTCVAAPALAVADQRKRGPEQRARVAEDGAAAGDFRFAAATTSEALEQIAAIENPAKAAERQYLGNIASPDRCAKPTGQARSLAPAFAVWR
jgi:hypothetical protein